MNPLETPDVSNPGSASKKLSEKERDPHAA
jgi:hypothetical protein